MDSMEELFIVDNEYLDNSATIMDLAMQAEEKLKAFCNILTGLRAEEAFIGVTAEAVEAFALSLLSLISDMLSTAGCTQKENMVAYVIDIEAADEALY